MLPVWAQWNCAGFQLHCTDCKVVLLRSPGCKNWFQAPKCKQFCEPLSIIMHYRTCSRRHWVTEPFRMEGTSGGPSSSIQLKAVSTLTSNQVAQGFIWLNLKTSKDGNFAPPLRNLLILLCCLRSELLFLNYILWDPPHGNLYLLFSCHTPFW